MQDTEGYARSGKTFKVKQRSNSQSDRRGRERQEGQKLKSVYSKSLMVFNLHLTIKMYVFLVKLL